LPGKPRQNNGTEVCKAIRSFSDAPILVLSAISDPEMVAHLLDIGADDFLAKPFSSGILLARINKMVRRVEGGTLATGPLGNSPGLLKTQSIK
jgi:two-component system catabolic regulation response regulator CreB